MIFESEVGSSRAAIEHWHSGLRRNDPRGEPPPGTVDIQAQKVIQKLESLTADEYDEEVFAMAPLASMPSEKMTLVPSSTTALVTKKSPQGLQRMLSLVDAFVVRNDLTKAQFLLTETEVEFGEHPEIQQRRKLLYNRQSSQLSKEDDEIESIHPILTRETAIRERKLALLKSVLRVIDRGQI